MMGAEIHRAACGPHSERAAMTHVQLGVRVRASGVLVALCGLSAAASPALAVLGSFGPNDGYSLNMYSGNYNWSDVSYYNAGAHGPNAGGGSAAFIMPDAGRWRVAGPVGGFFGNAGDRAIGTAGAPVYTSTPANAIPAYMVGAHFPGRNNDGYNLAFRNDTPAGTGPAIYEYDLDIYDTGGPAAASVTTGVVSTQFYLLADPDQALPPGQLPRDKFTMSWKDGAGNTGFEFGYSRDNQVSWRTTVAGAWNYTGIYINPSDWEGVRANIDLTNDTFGLDFYDESANLWITLAPAGTAMGTPMNNFTTLRWQLEDAVSNGIGGKNMFDDFTFNIPTPGALGVLGLGLGVWARRRRVG